MPGLQKDATLEFRQRRNLWQLRLVWLPNTKILHHRRKFMLIDPQHTGFAKSRLGLAPNTLFQSLKASKLKFSKSRLRQSPNTPFQGRKRRSDIRVSPKLKVPQSPRDLCYMSLARGLKGRKRRLDIGVFPKRSFVLYVPSTSTRVKRSFVLDAPSSRVKRQEKTIGYRSLS